MTKEEIKLSLRDSYFKETGDLYLGNIPKYADWLENKIVEYRQYVNQPLQQLISWMDGRIGLFNDDLPVSQRHAYDAYLNCLIKAKELAVLPDESGVKDNWVSVKERLPEILETVWISNGKGWTTLGCRSDLYQDTNDETGELEWHWCWAAHSGIIYEEDDKIVAECEEDDFDVKFWSPLPAPPKEEGSREKAKDVCHHYLSLNKTGVCDRCGRTLHEHTIDWQAD